MLKIIFAIVTLFFLITSAHAGDSVVESYKIPYAGFSVTGNKYYTGVSYGDPTGISFSEETKTYTYSAENEENFIHVINGVLVGSGMLRGVEQLPGGFYSSDSYSLTTGDKLQIDTLNSTGGFLHIVYLNNIKITESTNFINVSKARKSNHVIMDIKTSTNSGSLFQIWKDGIRYGQPLFFPQTSGNEWYTARSQISDDGEQIVTTIEYGIKGTKFKRYNYYLNGKKISLKGTKFILKNDGTVYYPTRIDSDGFRLTGMFSPIFSKNYYYFRYKIDQNNKDLVTLRFFLNDVQIGGDIVNVPYNITLYSDESKEFGSPLIFLTQKGDLYYVSDDFILNNTGKTRLKSGSKEMENLITVGKNYAYLRILKTEMANSYGKTYPSRYKVQIIYNGKPVGDIFYIAANSISNFTHSFTDGKHIFFIGSSPNDKNDQLNSHIYKINLE